MPPDVRRGSASPSGFLNDLGRSPMKLLIDGEAKPRLTSGGEAEALDLKMTLGVKAE